MQAMLNFADFSGVVESMIEFLLNTGSTIEEGRLAKGGSKLTEEYTQECAVCEMNPGGLSGSGIAAKGIGIHHGRPARRSGLCLCGRLVHAGQIFMPRAIWANVVVDPETFSTGSPLYKGSPVRVQPTLEEVLGAGDLTMKLYARGREVDDGLQEHSLSGLRGLLRRHPGGACWQSIAVKNACKMGNAKFQEIVSSHRIRQPLLREKGIVRPAPWEKAIERTAEILAAAKRPLIFMGSETSCEAMEVGLHLGEFLGAVVDSNSTVCHGPTAMGIQEAGRVGATAGQSKSRADLAVYWGSNPLESMPRHMSRYAVYPRGYWTRRGRFDRTIITVDPRKSITARKLRSAYPAQSQYRL